MRRPTFRACASDMMRSVSMPTAAASDVDATAADAKSSVWVIDPTRPLGHTGAPASLRPTCCAGLDPSSASIAFIAQYRPARYCARRLGIARCRADGIGIGATSGGSGRSR